MKKYIPYIAIVILMIALGFVFNSNKDLKLQKDIYNDQREIYEAEVHELKRDNTDLKSREGMFVDSIQSQNRKISVLRRLKSKVVYIPITKEIIAESDTSEIIQAINEGRQCLAELEISNMIIRELDTKIFYQDSVIFNLRASNENLTEQLRIRVEQMQLYESEIGSYKKHVRRIKWQRNFVIIGGVGLGALIILSQ